MENQPKQVVAEFLTAVKSLDLNKVRQLLDANVSWSQPGGNEVSGTKNSQEEVFEMIGRMFEISGNSLKLNTVSAISVNSNRVACRLHWTAEKNTGEKLDVDNIDIYTVENGKISRVEVFSADQTQEDSFWMSW